MSLTVGLTTEGTSMFDYTNLYVLEWSKRQNAFHIHTAAVALEKNLNMLLRNDSTDYVPLMIGSRQDCEQVADRWRHKLSKEPPMRRIRETA